MHSRRLKNLWFWAIAAIATLADRLTKIWVLQTFQLGETQPLLPGIFHFTYVTNTGAAFSLLAGSGWLKWLSLVVSLGLMALAIWGPRMNLWEQLGYGFILGGAVGNGIDRFIWGAVVDFLDFRWIRFPVFNIADVAINIGIICLLVVALRQPQGRDR
jgi:signal peptidase II